MISEMPKNNIGNLDRNRQDRINEIETYIQEYFEKYINNKDSSISYIQDTNLSRFFWNSLDNKEMEPIKNILEKKLDGKSLVDLGCGRNDGNLPLSLKIPLKEFTAVDIDVPEKEDQIYSIKKMKENGIKNASIVKEDLLRYVTNLPDKSTNFFLSAINDDVIMEEKYWKYLSEEISRVTEDKGIVIDGGVGLIGNYLDKDKFKIIYSEGDIEGKKIFEKN